MSTLKEGETFQDRLLSSIEGESVWRFAQRSGLKEGTIRKYLAGSVPGLDKAAAIAEAVGVNLEWLATGRGPMHPEEPEEGEQVKIPRYEAYLSARAGSWNLDYAKVIENIPFLKRWLLRTTNRETTEDLMLLEVDGDSMEPTIGCGDLVLIDRHNCDDRVDGIYAFVQEGTAKVKRLHFKSRALEIVSDNVHMYSKEVLTDHDLEAFHIIGRVRWIGKSLNR